MFTHRLNPGDIVTDQDINKIFGATRYRGMRKSNNNNLLVLIANHFKSIYLDRWEGETLRYTGEGQTGDQQLKGQNLTLKNMHVNNLKVFLFEVFKHNEYLYRGEVFLVKDPEIEYQFDKYNQMRKVYIFSLRLKEKYRTYSLPNYILDIKEEVANNKAVKMTDEQLELEIKNKSKNSRTKKTRKTNTYMRDPLITEYAKRWAKGICQLCDKKAPFINKKTKKPHLHTHHIVWMSKGGHDIIDNVIALCPNCHDYMHIQGKKEEVSKLKRKVSKHIKATFRE